VTLRVRKSSCRIGNVSRLTRCSRVTSSRVSAGAVAAEATRDGRIGFPITNRYMFYFAIGRSGKGGG
jgi:hypothetical protein